MTHGFLYNSSPYLDAVAGVMYILPMPYKNSEDRAARDSERNARRRAEKAARRLATLGDNRFSRWLDEILKSEVNLESKKTFASAAPTVLAEHLGVERSYISKLRHGTSPGIEMTFKIGVAFRDCGLAWCSGLYALRMRGFIAEEMALLDTLERRHEVNRQSLIEYGSVSQDAQLTLDLKAKVRLAKAVAGFAEYEERAYREWAGARQGSFGLLGAAYHLMQSGLDPVDAKDACDALRQRWMERPPAVQNLIAHFSDFNGET